MRWIKSAALWALAVLALGTFGLGLGLLMGGLRDWLTEVQGLSLGQALLVVFALVLALAGAVGGIAAEASRR